MSTGGDGGGLGRKNLKQFRECRSIFRMDDDLKMRCFKESQNSVQQRRTITRNLKNAQEFWRRFRHFSRNFFNSGEDFDECVTAWI